MDEKIREKVILRCLEDNDVERYASLAGKKATKTDTRAVAENVIPLLVDQLDAKLSKPTKTSEKLFEAVKMARDPAIDQDPKFASDVLNILLGTKKGEVITTNADTLLVHPFVIEFMINAMVPEVLRAFGWALASAAPARPEPPMPPMPGPEGPAGRPPRGRAAAQKPAPAPAPEPAPAPKRAAKKAAPEPAPEPAPKKAAPKKAAAQKAKTADEPAPAPKKAAKKAEPAQEPAVMDFFSAIADVYNQVTKKK